MKLAQLSQSKVAIWGYGVEGQATCAYLLQQLPEQSFTVLCPEAEIPNPAPQQLNFQATTVDAQLLSQFDVVIKSPGITPYQAAVEQSSCQIISGSALWFSNEKSGQVIAITGTKGKSTAAAMLAEILQVMGKKVVLAGNFGVPLISCIERYDYVVLETSSYQAQDGSIKADVAVLLNLFSEHLNWHLTEAQYHADKWRLIQQAKTAILNAKDDNTKHLLATSPPAASLSYFETPHGFYELNEVLMYQDKALLSQHGWLLKGAHNLKNAAAVCQIITVLKLDIKVALNGLRRFRGLPHRLEFLGELAGVNYINDSIASTPHATMAALQTLEPQKTLILVGGFDRGVDWQWWVDAIQAAPPKVIVCSGENGKKIHQLVLNQGIKTQCIWQPSLKSAVKTAKAMAQTGDWVLLSPGAPSFDAFNDYQHRGQKFTQWIQ